MKFTHKYLNPIAVYLCVYIFGLWLFGFGCEAVEWIYTYLNHLMPDIFPLYNPIYDPEAHARLNKTWTVVGIFVTLFLINFIALRLENKKYERIIVLTDGQYLLKDGMKLYFKEFAVSDVVTAVILPVCLTIPPYFISEDTLGKFGLIIFTWLGYNMSLLYEIVPAVITVAIFSIVGRALSVPLAVRSYRAAWLSDI